MQPLQSLDDLALVIVGFEYAELDEMLVSRDGVYSVEHMLLMGYRLTHPHKKTGLRPS
jgi:hypothetical protein